MNYTYLHIFRISALIRSDKSLASGSLRTIYAAIKYFQNSLYKCRIESHMYILDYFRL